MNPWDIDPSLYAGLWRLLREWYLRRYGEQRPAPPAAPSERPAGCRA